jgi:hypothetical protein
LTRNERNCYQEGARRNRACYRSGSRSFGITYNKKGRCTIRIGFVQVYRELDAPETYSVHPTFSAVRAFFMACGTGRT